MKTIKINEVIKKKRLELNLSQEALAEAFDLSIQAISKWENGLSYPDITLLPRICEYFNINMEQLFFGIEEADNILDELPDDNIYRIVQCIGKTIVDKENWDSEKRVKLLLPQNESAVNMEIWGSADIKGNVNGDVKAGGGVNCGEVYKNVNSGGGVNCGGVSGGVEAGGGVNCGGVNGNVKAGGGINCGGVGGNAESKGNIRCGNISGSVTAQKIICKKISGEIKGGKVFINNDNVDEEDFEED